jgi:hypothetical protein
MEGSFMHPHSFLNCPTTCRADGAIVLDQDALAVVYDKITSLGQAPASIDLIEFFDCRVQWTPLIDLLHAAGYSTDTVSVRQGDGLRERSAAVAVIASIGTLAADLEELVDYFESTPFVHLFASEKDLYTHHGENIPEYPKVIFSSSMSSGTNLTGLILGRLLDLHGYHMARAMPHFGAAYDNDFFLNLPPRSYCFQHIDTYDLRNIFGKDDVKIIFQYRDPRDILISNYKFYRYCTDKMNESRRNMIDEAHLKLSDKEALHQLILGTLGKVYLPAKKIYSFIAEWVEPMAKKQCHFLRFEDMKANGFLQLKKIMNYIGLDVLDKDLADISIEIDPFRTKRTRGVEDTRSYYRQGGSGYWKKYFDDSMKEDYKMLFGDLLICLGYERNNNW